MTESSYTSEITSYLGNAGCVVFKHADRFTTGIPDLSVTTRGNTTWFEVKLLKKGEGFLDRVAHDKAQLVVMGCLGAMGRAYYLIRKDAELWVFKPQFLQEHQGYTPVELEFRRTRWVPGGRFPLTLLDNGPVSTSASNYQLVLNISQS